MTSIISTGSQSVTAATSITIPLGSTPAVGELVLVFLGTSNEIVVHPPGWNVIPSGGQGPNQNAWTKVLGIQSRGDASKLEVYYHTWNAADSGNSATFNFSPAPSLGIGDKDLSNANAQAIALVLSACGVQEYAPQGTLDLLQSSLVLPPVKQQNSGGAIASVAFTNGQSVTFTNSDAGAVSQGAVSTASGSLAAWTSSGSPGYRPTVRSSAAGELLGAFLSVNDATPNIYLAPVIYEGPVAQDALLYRYTLARFYTVLNNGGVFTANRYISTDQYNAATQVFTNNAPVKAADVTNLLNSGVGGDFRYSITGS